MFLSKTLKDFVDILQVRRLNHDFKTHYGIVYVETDDCEETFEVIDLFKCLDSEVQDIVIFTASGQMIHLVDFE